MYIKTIKIASFDVDRNGKAKVSSIMRYFQQIARENLDEFGMTYDFLRENNIVFVLTKYKIKILSNILSDTEYVFKTAPCAVQGVSFIRDFVIEDLDGKRVAEASSSWIIINYLTRSIMRPNKLPKTITPSDKLVDFSPDRIRTNVLDESSVLDAMNNYSTKVSYTMLDQNNHLNNCNYADILADGLFENGIEFTDSYQIDMSFDHEAKVLDELNVHFSKDKENLILASCENKTENTTCFTAEISL